MACLLCRRRQNPVPQHQHKEDQTKYHELPHLPVDIINSILLRFPTKSLLRCKTLSKSWHQLITRDQQFINMHVKNNFLLPPPGIFITAKMFRNSWLTEFNLIDHNQKSMRIQFNPELHDRRYFSLIASCNGLLCFENLHLSQLVICNPITKETMEVRVPTEFESCNPEVYFGFDAANNRYKLVLFCRNHTDVFSPRDACILTLGETCWRKLDHLPTQIMGSVSDPVFLQGAFYWIIIQETGTNHHLVSLDICNEKLRLCMQFDSSGLKDSRNWSILIDHGKYLGLMVYNLEFQHIETWYQANEQDEMWRRQRSSTQVLSLLNKQCCKNHKFRLIRPVGDDSLLLSCTGGHSASPDQFLLFTPKSGRGSIYLGCDDDDTDLSVFSFTPSLLSPLNLKSISRVGGTVMGGMPITACQGSMP